MTTEEFDIWFKAHRLAFPELSDWLRSSEDAAGTIGIWREVLGEVPLEVAKSVTRRMLTGDLEHLDKWACSKLPRIVLGQIPRKLPTIEELNDPKTGWTGQGGYRAK